jgi:CDGSH-type Zn-finger protein
MTATISLVLLGERRERERIEKQCVEGGYMLCECGTSEME